MRSCRSSRGAAIHLQLAATVRMNYRGKQGPSAFSLQTGRQDVRIDR